MSSRPHKTTRMLPVLFLIVVHLVAIIVGGYFLSPEFTVYPFLASRGFLPYTNIIDQHFPALLFGPISLPFFLTANPYPLLILFLLVTAATDLFFYLALIRRQVVAPQAWLLLWITFSYWFSGNTLWLETFVGLFLAIVFFTSTNRKSLVNFASGFLFGLIFLIKPTFVFSLILLFFALQFSVGLFFIAGLASPLLITGLYFFKFDLLPAFLYLTFDFNRRFYVVLAAKAPTVRLLVETSLFFGGALVLFLRRQKFLFTALVISAFVLAYPRFGYIHLAPALLLSLFFLAQTTTIRPALLVGAVLLFVFALAKNYRHHYGNFYLDSETIKLASYLKTKPETSLYILGGNDLLYPLTNRIPPGFTYLPSLPWYWQDDVLSQKVVTALTDSPTTQVLVKSNALLDGANIQASGGLIGEFIKENYRPKETIGNYQVYQRIFK